MTVLRAIAVRDDAEVLRCLASRPDLTTSAMDVGATRADAETYFLAEIGHHVYEGDTALHVAAAAHHRALAEVLVAMGADVRARNRRGAEPLHYAADGSPSADSPRADAQLEVIAFLVDAGADPNALDKDGVAPLHRAVRTRSSAAVRSLVEHGADPHLTNGRGSTPLDLARHHTGKSGAGSPEAKAEQERIIAFLLTT